MTLYEFDMAIAQCTDENGEVIDFEKLNQLMLDRQRKLEGVAYWVKNLRSDLDQVEQEQDRLDKIASSLKNRIKSLTEWLKFALNGEKIKTPTLSVYQTTRDKTNVTDLDQIPEMFRTYSWKPDLRSIKDAINAGQEVPGAEVVRNTSLVIK